MTAFFKMHGLGNDFVVFDARAHTMGLDEACTRAIADRRWGVGCDQVVVIERGKSGGDAFMRIYNADGDEVEACGNAARCVARLLMEERDQPAIHLDSRGGPLLCRDAGGGRVTVDMGQPRLAWQEIPLSRAVATDAFPLHVGRQEFTAAAVSMGNPHCVILVDDAEKVALSELGAEIERHELFPARTNVGFVNLRSPYRLRLRVWERGAGITKACGTGACAAVVAAHRRGLGARDAIVELDGGTLHVAWRAGDDHVLMTGETALTFKGDVDLTALERRQ